MADDKSKDTTSEITIIDIEPGKSIPGKDGVPLEEKMERPRPWPEPPPVTPPARPPESESGESEGGEGEGEGE